MYRSNYEISYDLSSLIRRYGPLAPRWFFLNGYHRNGKNVEKINLLKGLIGSLPLYVIATFQVWSIGAAWLLLLLLKLSTQWMKQLCKWHGSLRTFLYWIRTFCKLISLSQTSTFNLVTQDNRMLTTKDFGHSCGLPQSYIIRRWCWRW